MTKEQAIEVLHELDGSLYETQQIALDMAIKALEQQSSDDKVTITMDKDTLKYSGKGYVVYNKDWFRKHFATEVKIMTGYDGYKEQSTSDDCVSRTQALSAIRNLYPSAPFIRANWEKWREKNKKYIECEDIIKALPPVTPTHGTCKDCRHCREDFSFTDKPMCLTHGLITVNDDFYCKDYEKRGE